MTKKTKPAAGGDGSTFPKKYLSKLPDGHEDKIQAMSEEEIKASLIEYEQEINKTEKEMELDSSLTDAKTTVKEIAGGYKDFIKSRDAMRKYAVYVLESRGAA